MRFTLLLLVIVLLSCNGANLRSYDSENHADKLIPEILPILIDGWQRTYIANFGSFDLPPTMEIQLGKYRQGMNELYKRMEYTEPIIVAQQKGLNSTNHESLNKYSRVIFETAIGKDGSYEKLNFDITSFSQSELELLNLNFRNIFTSDSQAIKIIEWYPLKVELVNSMSCIHLRYLRQLEDFPFVLVNMYIFQNYDRKHTLTMSYRLSEKDYWESDFDILLKSLRIDPADSEIDSTNEQ